MIEPKDDRTARAWAYALRVLVEHFSELPATLVLRGTEDVSQAVRVTTEYIFRCYRSRDPNFNLDLVREGAAVAGPEAEERLQRECQGAVDYVTCIFRVEAAEK